MTDHDTGSGGPDQPRDPVDERSFMEAERAKAEAERLRKETEQLRSEQTRLRAQVEDLKGIAQRSEEGPPPPIQRMHLLHIQPVRDILVIGMIVGVFWLGYVLRPITVPLLLALTLAYLVEPVVRRVVKRGWMTRMQAAAAVIMVAVVVLTVPLTVGGTIAISQGAIFTDKVQRNIALVQAYVKNPEDSPERLAARAQLESREERSRAWLRIAETVAGFSTPDEEVEVIVPDPDAPAADPETPPPPPPEIPGQGPEDPLDETPQLSTEPPKDGTVPPTPDPAAAAPPASQAGRITNWLATTFEQNLQGLGRLAARYIVGTGAGALDIGLRALLLIGYLFFAAFLVMFFFFFLCTGFERVTNSLTNLIPTWKRSRTLNLLSQMDAVIAGFVRGRLIIMGILMVMFTMGYWLIGVPGAIIVGPITGILAVVPYLGLVSIPTAMLLMWLQPMGPAFMQTWWWILIAPVATYFFIQTIEDYVLTPTIQGKATQMDTPSILFAVLAGGILAGFYGVLLAIPAAACIKILMRETFWPRFEAWADGRVKDFLPISRYDPTEARLATPEKKQD